MSTYTPLDIAELIMSSRSEQLTAKQVQKLMYYAHVVHMSRTGEALVPGGFQAWRNGPVSPSVYDQQRGDWAPRTVHGRPDRVPPTERESVEIALDLYGDRSEEELIALSHGDGPWTLARGPIPPAAPSREPIPDDTIAKVLVPTVERLLAAKDGRRLSLDDFKAEFSA